MMTHGVQMMRWPGFRWDNAFIVEIVLHLCFCGFNYFSQYFRPTFKKKVRLKKKTLMGQNAYVSFSWVIIRLSGDSFSQHFARWFIFIFFFPHRVPRAERTRAQPLFEHSHLGLARDIRNSVRSLPFPVDSAPASLRTASNHRRVLGRRWKYPRTTRDCRSDYAVWCREVSIRIVNPAGNLFIVEYPMAHRAGSGPVISLTEALWENRSRGRHNIASLHPNRAQSTRLFIT